MSDTTQKLHDSTLVQWHDGSQWHRGRVIHNDDGEPIRDQSCECWLVRHSYTGELEMVPWERLERMAEEHAE